MSYTFDRKKKKKSKVFMGIIITIGIIISIYLLSIFNIPFFSKMSSNVIYGVDSFFSSITGVIKNGVSYLGNNKKLNLRIEELQKDLEETKISLNELKALEVENSDLKKMLKINEKYNHFNKIYANIITRSYDSWNESFVINKGSKDGIKLRQSVIAENGLVGYISKVEETTSEVTTILDSSSAVSVEISNINALALVKGDNSLKDKNEIKLVNIPIAKELAKDEIIYTSGIGELYKKGIPVGKISEVVNKKNDIDRFATVKIFVDISSIDMVAVIK